MATSHPSITILLVDDSEIDRAVSRRYLKSAAEIDCEIFDCETGDEALTFCQQTCPDVVLLDYLLPDTDGIALMRDLEQQLEFLPLIILLTGRGDEAIAVEAMKNGARDYLIKGQFTPERLVQSVVTLLSARNQQRQLQQQRQQGELLTRIALSVNQMVELPQILQTAADGARHLLGCDRILIYQFEPDMSGTVVAESVLTAWTAAIGQHFEDNCFQGEQSHQAKKYQQGHIVALEDVEASDLSACHLKMLQRLQVRANLVVPILFAETSTGGSKLWGLLIAHHCQAPRLWSSDEQDLLKELSVQVSSAIQQAELNANLKTALQKQQETDKILRKAQAQIGQFLQSDLIGILFGNINGEVQETNDEFLRIVGYSRQDLEAGEIRWDQITPPEFLWKDYAGIAEAQSNGSCTPYEKEYIRKDGSRIPVLVGYVLLGGDRTESIAFILDITERKRAERALEAAKNDLEQRVQERTAELTQTNIRLEAEVAERLEREQQLRQTAHQLGVSNRALQDFAYVASHDLQEPLRKIQSFGDLLHQKYSSQLDEQGQRFIGRMQSAANRMQVLIRDLLAYSRLNTRVPPFVSVNLNTVLADVLTDLEMQVEKTAGQVEVSNLPSLEAAPVQMRQLFQNLIGNALKFCRPDTPPRITVSYVNVGQAAEIQIKDNGIGFNLEYLDRIFTPFERLHLQSEYEGTGMGLAICRKIVENHGGQLTASSSDGEGATFLVTLPFTQQDSMASTSP